MKCVEMKDRDGKARFPALTIRGMAPEVPEEAPVVELAVPVASSSEKLPLELDLSETPTDPAPPDAPAAA